MRLATVAAVLVVSASAIAEPVSSSDMLVVVLQKQNGTRETHSQSIEADDCGAMLKLFKELNEKGQSLTLNLGTPNHGTAEALDIYCINANGEAVDWHGTALTAEQVQQRTDELITKEPK
jgi:hypothetical protein